MPALDKLINQTETVIVLDELDRRFHTLLSRSILTEILEKKHSHSQLIFTTHDTNLLDLDIFRRDEIWFVEKDMNQATKLYSLVEFKVRTDLRVEKGYLNGRFGAIPFTTNTNAMPDTTILPNIDKPTEVAVDHL